MCLLISITWLYVFFNRSFPSLSYILHSCHSVKCRFTLLSPESTSAFPRLHTCQTDCFNSLSVTEAHIVSVIQCPTALQVSATLPRPSKPSSRLRQLQILAPALLRALLPPGFTVHPGSTVARTLPRHGHFPRR